MDPVTAGLGLVDTFLNKFVKDKDLAAKLAAQARSEEFQGELESLKGQLAINQQEAAHKSLFVAGWRPFIGWICGFGLAYNVLINPILSTWFTMPPVDPGLLYPVLTGMLGLGAMRSWEKSRGVGRER